MSNVNPEGVGTLPSADGAGNNLNVAVVDANGHTAGSADLPAELFGVAPNIPLIHQVVVAQLAAARQGTHKVKGRGEVSGSGSKPWRQKGTGRARHGSRRSPQWTGGGVVHGPVPRDYAQRTPKKMIAAALRGALSDRAAENRVHVVSNLIEGQTPSTKQALAALARVTSAAKVLVVLHRDEDIAWLSLRNAVDVHVLSVDQLNAYDVLIADEVVFTGAALDTFVSNAGKARNAADADAEPTNAELSAQVPTDATEETGEPSNAQLAADANVEEPK